MMMIFFLQKQQTDLLDKFMLTFFGGFFDFRCVMETFRGKIQIKPPPSNHVLGILNQFQAEVKAYHRFLQNGSLVWTNFASKAVNDSNDIVTKDSKPPYCLYPLE